MPLDPNIPLQVQTAKLPDPMTSIAGLMQLRGQLSDIALRQAQVETARQNAADIQAQAQQRNRDLADQNTIQSLESDPAVYAKIHAGDLSPLAGKVQPKTFDSVQKFVNEAIEKKMTLDTSKLAQEQAAHKEIGQTLDSLQRMTGADGALDLDRVNQSLPGAINALSTQLRVIGIDPLQLPKSVHSPEELQRMASQAGALGALTDAALARKKTQSETEQANAAAASSQATAADKQFDLQLKQGALSGGSDAAIDARFAGNPDAAAAAKAAFRQNLPAGVDKATEAVNTIYANTIGAKQKIDSETGSLVDRQAKMLPGEAKLAGARAMAEIPAHVAETVQSAKAIANASPGAFAPILDRGARESAITDTTKIQKDYTDTAIGAQRLLDTISAAQNGNKAAPSAIIIEQVRSVLSNGRLNTTELKAVSSQAGSLMDRIQGWVSGHTEGQPIPADILRDTAALATI